MTENEFRLFVATLRSVYLGRTTTAEAMLWTLDPAILADWYRLAETFRGLIGDVGCRSFTVDHRGHS